MRKRKKAPRLWTRGALCLFLLLTGFAGLLLRLLSLQPAGDPAVAADAAERSVFLASSRGYIYDRALRPLVNARTRTLTAALTFPEEPDPLAAYADCGVLADSVRKSGVCLLFESETRPADSETARSVTVAERYAPDQLCRHLIGYVDADGRGVCGIEKAFDRLLAAAGGSVSLRYAANAAGQALRGAALTVEDDGYLNPAGVVLTVDRRFQIAAEDALRQAEVRRGAVVILRVRDSAILASASVPAYSTDRLADALSDPDLPFLDRALAAYPVGSVFKPFVAAAAVDRGVGVNVGFPCEGTLDVGGAVFSCYNKNAHGETDLTGAIVNSCNTYFIDLAGRIGAAPLLETASAFGFGKRVSLTGTLESAAGTLPDLRTLEESPAALANLSFGQGELTASPLQIAAAYAALARGGQYKPPYLMQAIVNAKGEETAYYEPDAGGFAASPEACRIVNASLRENMLRGTGVNGQPANGTAAGKTATAQTGSYDDRGVERLCTWFCGFVPYEDPMFVIVVFREDGAAAATDCAPVFRAVAERILLFPDAAA